MDEKSVIERLRGFGISVTQPRIAIMEYLMKNHIHPNVEDIYNALKEQLPHLSLTTVYNTVKVFADNGAITFLTIDEKNICIEENTKPHGHLLCLRCGRTIDIPLQGIDPHTTTLCGHQIDEIHQYYKGICSDCLAAEQETTKNLSNNL